MKKPINKFAVGLWVLAGMYVIGEVWAYLYFSRMELELIRVGGKPHVPAFLSTPPSLVLDAAILASLGMLIEIGDRIRWLLERKTDQASN